MAKVTYDTDGYEPVEGDVVMVPPKRLKELVGYPSTTVFVSVPSLRDSLGDSDPAALTTLDRQHIPRPSEICRRPLELVADADCWQMGAHLMVPWDWSPDFDLQVGLPDWAIVVELDEPVKDHVAKAVKRRVIAAVALAFFYTAIGGELWRLRQRPMQIHCLQEAEVFLDRVREETDDYDVFHELGASAKLHRGWPRWGTIPDEQLRKMRAIVTCAVEGGKAKGSRKGLRRHSQSTPTRMAVPSWDIEPLRQIILSHHPGRLHRMASVK